jgi:hypothetical protein
MDHFQNVLFFKYILNAAVRPLPCTHMYVCDTPAARTRRQRHLISITALSSELACQQQSQIDTLRAVSCSNGKHPALRRSRDHH